MYNLTLTLLYPTVDTGELGYWAVILNDIRESVVEKPFQK